MNDWETRVKLVTLFERHIIEDAVSKGLDRAADDLHAVRIKRLDSVERMIFDLLDSESVEGVYEKKCSTRKKRSLCGTGNIWTHCSAICKSSLWS